MHTYTTTRTRAKPLLLLLLLLCSACRLGTQPTPGATHATPASTQASAPERRVEGVTAQPAAPLARPTARPTPSAPTPTPTPDGPDPAAVRARLPVPALCYHAIRDWTARDRPDDRAYVTPPARFAAEMDLLDRQGFQPISPDLLYAYLTSGAPLPERPVLLTFDDADGTQWSAALPVLQKHHFTATFFIMTVVLDKPGYLSREQVRQLDALGMTIGAHTWDHHAVTTYAEADWSKQITRPTEQIAEIVGHPVRYFAYPYGLWDQPALARPELAGFAAAFGLNTPADPQRPLLSIPRRIANGYWSDARFIQALGQMQPPASSARVPPTPQPGL